MGSRTYGAEPMKLGANPNDNVRVGRMGAAVVQQGHDPFYELIKNGRCFVGQTAITGLAMAIYSGKANMMTLWNPSNSGHDIMLLEARIVPVSTNTVLGGTAYGLVTDTGSTVATGQPFATFTEATPYNAYIGGGFSSVAKFANAVVTTTANPAILKPAFSTNTATVATLEQAPRVIVDHPAILLPPGNAVQLVGITAVATLFAMSFMWEEIPV